MVSEWAAQVIGINYYPDYTTLKPLTAAAEDAEKIAGQLKQYGYRPFRVQCLPGTLNQKGESKIDHQGFVKVPELQEVIVNLFNPPPPNPTPETALFFFSGHGWCRTVAGQKEVFLATSDAYPEAEIYGIRLSWLGEQLQISRAKRVVVWLDCCYSGELLNFIPKDKDYCLITATRSYETGVEIPHTQGLLTQALLAGLNPENDPDGIINSHKLADFINSRMADTVQRPLIANSPRAILLTTKFSQKSFQDLCPYRSLSYFTETKEDAEVFYGRSALTQQLIQQVDKYRLVAVLGASGSGKSSLLRAGLLYQLKLGQEIPESDRWTNKLLRSLLAEAYLAKFGDWQMLNGVAQEYIQQSQELQNRLQQDEAASRKHEIITVWGIAVGCLVAVGLGLMVWQKNGEAQFNQAESGGRYSLSLFDQHQDLEAVVEAIRAEKILQKLTKTNPEVRSALTNVLYNRSQRNRLEGHYDAVYSVSVSPDGKTLASGGGDGIIKLWKVKTGETIHTLPKDDKVVNSVSFSPDGKTLASGGDDNKIKLWKVETGEKIHTLEGHKYHVNSVSFSPDGKTLASGSQDGTIILWKVETGEKIHTLQGHSGPVICFA